MENNAHRDHIENGEPATLSVESLDRLADIVVAKLIERNSVALPSKQVVAGSSPVSRSTRRESHSPCEPSEPFTMVKPDRGLTL